MQAAQCKKYAFATVVCLVLGAASAGAQSTIAGQVRDTTGAVLPGVTVEASSPVLIEKTRTMATDEQGRYTLVNLRPGRYALVFSLAGFSTARRDEIDVTSDVTIPINVELRVGALEETLTVTGDTPVVDVQGSQRTQVISREVLEALPTSRAVSSLGQILPGVKMSRPDLGGTNSMEQSYGWVHGAAVHENAMIVDGMNAKVNNDIGGSQYFNSGMTQELVYQTSAVAADTPSGGVRINLVPRDGGNTFRGEFFVTGAPGAWMSDNITPELIARGLETPSRIQHIYDINPGYGGPIVRDRMWFYGSVRKNSVNEMPAGSFYHDGRPGVEDQYVNNASARLTWQLNPTHKLTLYKDRAWKFKGHEIPDSGVEVETSARRDPKMYYLGQVKLTSVLSSRLFFENGYGISMYNRQIGNQQGVMKPRGSAEWLAGAQRQDLVLGTSTTSVADTYALEAGYSIHNSMTYVTGSHNVKAGLQWRWGPEADTIDRNADLIQRYRNGAPDSVQVFTTPVDSREHLNADLGLYFQDTWTIKRLTIAPGLRYNYFNSSVMASCAGQGRFAPLRCVEDMPDLPNWKDWTPRFGAAYDLFGNQKTALKASANKYMRTWATAIARRYNPLLNDNDIRNWRDSSGDDIAQDSEIGPSNKATFGIKPSRRPADDLAREYDWEYTAAVQHQLVQGVSLVGAYYRRNSPKRERQDNLLVDPFTDYIPFVAASPLDGQPVTIFKLRPEKQGQVDVVDSNSDINKRTYDGFEVSFNARLPRGAFAFGGWTMDKLVIVTCDTDDPNQWRFCDMRGTLYQEYGTGSRAPFRHEVKLNLSLQLPWGVQSGVAFSSLATGIYGGRIPEDQSLNVLWSVPASLFPGGRTQSVTVPLIPRGTSYLPRWNQLDVSFKKSVRLLGGSVQGMVDIYNVTNASTVLGEITAFGPSLGIPNQTLLGRLVKLGVRLRF